MHTIDCACADDLLPYVPLYSYWGCGESCLYTNVLILTRLLTTPKRLHSSYDYKLCMRHDLSSSVSVV